MKNKEVKSKQEVPPQKTSRTSSENESNACASDDVQCAADDMCAEEQAVNLNDIASKLDAALIEAERNKDLYLRTVADLDTYRRKVQREKEELAKFAIAPLIEELLPSLDHLEMAISSAKASNEAPALVTGVEMVYSQVRRIFADFGVVPVDADGKEFDPKTEECVAHEASDTIPENQVIKVMRAGYMCNGRLLRPASVVVSSGKKAVK